LLHLGHAYAALFAWERAQEVRGRFLLRIEDIDEGRCRPEFVDDILEDLAWLGIEWERPIRRQSEHFAEYRSAIDRLQAEGLLYPCFCTRAEIRAEIARAGGAPQGPEGPAYPGICRSLTPAERHARIAAGEGFALRLDAAQAAARVGKVIFEDHDAGRIAVDPLLFGDVVLARKEMPASYHLAVTVDDALQGVTLVTRGVDLLLSTHIHRLLQALLGLATPAYWHHRLIINAAGARLSKRDGALSLRALRAAGHTPEQVRKMAMA
jgi:glutamyl-Q tRNA(Asp) synthetase